MHDCIGLKDVLHISIESRESVMGRAAFRHQQTHRVAFIAERRLHSDENIVELYALNQQIAAR